MGVMPVESDDSDRLVMERDLAVRQAKLSEADLKVIQMALNENRPLEALRTVNQGLDRLDEELEALDEIRESEQVSAAEVAERSEFDSMTADVEVNDA